MPDGDCVSVTTVPCANATLQTPLVVPSLMPQLIPAGLLVMLPLPRDAGDGDTVSVDGAAGGGGVVGVVGDGGVGAGSAAGRR